MFAVLWSSVAQGQVFQNQLHNFGDPTADVISHAQQMGYDFILGQPWSNERAVQGTAAGLKVMFNSTAGEDAKWLKFNNPGGVGSLTKPTKVNGVNIPASLYPELTKTLCMKSTTAPQSELKQKYRIVPKYENPGQVVFFNNYRCSSAIDLMVSQNEWLRELHGGAAVYHGLFLDQVNPESAAVIPTTCLNPCLSDPNETVYATQVDGQLEYIRRMKAHFNTTLEGLGTAGNPWKITNYTSRPNPEVLDMVYNEMGQATENNPTTWNLTPGLGAVQLPYTVSTFGDHAKDANYPTALVALGTAAVNGAWFGWYGEAHLDESTNSTQLARALPNWDNIAGATSRTWDPTTKVYASTNSYADPSVIYSRQTRTKRLFAVRQATGASITIGADERIVGAGCVDALFLETGNCVTGYFTQSGTTVNFGSSVVNGAGYVLYYNRQPIVSTIVVPSTNKVNVCYAKDDDVPMLPATGSSGWSVKVNGVLRTPSSKARLTDNCFQLGFAAGTITLPSQVVTVSSTGGNITTGVSMINTTAKVPALPFSWMTAVNLIGQ